MLEMIFANNDLSEFPEYNNLQISSQVQYNDKKKINVEVLVNDYQHMINIDDEPDWGYYIDLDNTTPPNKNYSKNKNTSPPMLNLPKKNYTINKPIKYLPTVEEEVVHISSNNSTNKSYIIDEITSSSSVISGVTFCATIAFYYFFKKYT